MVYFFVLLCLKEIFSINRLRGVVMCNISWIKGKKEIGVVSPYFLFLEVDDFFEGFDVL